MSAMSNNSKRANTPSQKKTSSKNMQKKFTSKQVFAIIGIVILIAMYLVTLVAAFTDSSASGGLFAMCLFASFAIPFLIWIYSWLYQKMIENRTNAFSDSDSDWELNSDVNSQSQQ